MPRQPDVPCAGCGELIWRSATSLPEGLSTCRACRLAGIEHGTRAGYGTLKCRCVECRAWNAGEARAYAAAFKALNGFGSGTRYAKKNTTTKHGNAVPRAVRLEVYERDQWTCQLCMDPVDPALHHNDRMSATLDHVECQTWALMPDHSTSNLRLAHRRCNSTRGNRAA